MEKTSEKIKKMLISNDLETINLGIIFSRQQLRERERIDLFELIQRETPRPRLRLFNGKIKKSKK